MIRTIRIRKPRWLSHIYLLLQQAMKKGILHIKLPKRPTASDRKREKKPDGGRLDHWTEGVFIVKAIALSKTASNETRFIALNSPIRVLLHLEDPFRVNDINSWWWRNKSPRLITKKSMILLFHSLSPMRNTHSSLVCAGLGGRICNCGSHTRSMPSDSTVSALLGAKNATSAARMRA
jgi:hypothetical protein